MKTTIVLGPKSGIETIVDTWMLPNMAVLVGDEEMAVCKDGKILVVNIKEFSQEATELWRHLNEMGVIGATQPL